MLPDYIKDNDVSLTLEGDNKVIMMQTAQFLLKNLQKVMLKDAPAIETCEYLQEFKERGQDFFKVGEDLMNPQNLIHIFKACGAQLLMSVAQRLQKKMEEDDMFDAFTGSVPFGMNRAVLAYGQVYTIQAFHERVQTIKHEGTKKVFMDLFLIYANNEFIIRASDFRMGGLLSSE